MLLLVPFTIMSLAACEVAPDERDVELELGRHEVELERRDGVVTDVDIDRNIFEYDWGFETDFGSWDLDQDVKLSWDEYYQGWSALGVVEAWDLDGNGWLSVHELATSLFDAWDQDEDATLDIAEFRWGARAWFDRPNTYGAFTSWDDNGDGVLTLPEYRDGLVDRDLWDEWDGDTDERLTDQELARVLWTAWDVDDDGFIDVLEYRWNRPLSPFGGSRRPPGWPGHRPARSRGCRRGRRSSARSRPGAGSCP